MVSSFHYKHRYKIYIEGSAWSVSEKYILACDSVSLLVKPHYYDFFTRGLMPVHHYWPVSNDDKCKSIKFTVDWGNSHKQKVISYLGLLRRCHWCNCIQLCHYSSKFWNVKSVMLVLKVFRLGVWCMYIGPLVSTSRWPNKYCQCQKFS